MTAKKKAARSKVFATSNCGGDRYEWVQRGKKFGLWDPQRNRWIDEFAGDEEMTLRLIELNGLVTNVGEEWLSSRHG